MRGWFLYYGFFMLARFPKVGGRLTQSRRLIFLKLAADFPKTEPIHCPKPEPFFYSNRNVFFGVASI